VSDLTTWRARRAALAALLDEPDAGDRRDALKADIIVLYKSIEQSVTELNVLKD
jgi:hypothetical protein